MSGRGDVRLVLSDAWVDVEAAAEAIHRAEGAVGRGAWAEAWGPGRVALTSSAGSSSPARVRPGSSTSAACSRRSSYERSNASASRASSSGRPSSSRPSAQGEISSGSPRIARAGTECSCARRGGGKRRRGARCLRALARSTPRGSGDRTECPDPGALPRTARLARNPRMSALVDISAELSTRVEALRFPSVPFVYNPLVYARIPHEAYLERWGTKTPRELLLVGMNPGPFGMAQTGVPFGDVAMVRDLLGIDGPWTSLPSNIRSGRCGLRVRAQRSERHAALGLGARSLRDAGALLPPDLRGRTTARSSSWRRREKPHTGQAPGAGREALFAPCDDALRGSSRSCVRPS